MPITFPHKFKLITVELEQIKFINKTALLFRKQVWKKLAKQYNFLQSRKIIDNNTESVLSVRRCLLIRLQFARINKNIAKVIRKVLFTLLFNGGYQSEGL